MLHQKRKNDPHIIELPKRKIIGKLINMSLSDDRTFELFSSFMPRLKEINNKTNSDKLCVRVYPGNYRFSNFDFNACFDKWSAVEVSDLQGIPDGMNECTIPAGLYAVFIHKGPASGANNIFKYIFTDWLPNSGYEIDQRPHYDIMGEKYKHDAADSEEEICIPIKPKN